MEDCEPSLKPSGDRFDFQTPPPEFATGHVEPLSPQLAPSSMTEAVVRLTEFSQPAVSNITTSPNFAAPPQTQHLVQNSYFSSTAHIPHNLSHNLSLLASNSTTWVDPMVAFAEIALSTAPPGFMSRSSSPPRSYSAATPSSSLSRPIANNGVDSHDSTGSRWGYQSYTNQGASSSTSYGNFGGVPVDSTSRIPPPPSQHFSAATTAASSNTVTESATPLAGPSDVFTASNSVNSTPPDSTIAPKADMAAYRPLNNEHIKPSTRRVKRTGDGMTSSDEREFKSSGSVSSKSSRGPKRVAGRAIHVGGRRHSRNRKSRDDMGETIRVNTALGVSPSGSSSSGLAIGAMEAPAVHSSNGSFDGVKSFPSPSPAYSPYPSRQPSPEGDRKFSATNYRTEEEKADYPPNVVGGEASTPSASPEVMAELETVETVETVDEETAENVVVAPEVVEAEEIPVQKSSAEDEEILATDNATPVSETAEIVSEAKIDVGTVDTIDTTTEIPVPADSGYPENVVVASAPMEDAQITATFEKNGVVDNAVPEEQQSQAEASLPTPTEELPPMEVLADLAEKSAVEVTTENVTAIALQTEAQIPEVESVEPVEPVEPVELVEPVEPAEPDGAKVLEAVEEVKEDTEMMNVDQTHEEEVAAKEPELSPQDEIVTDHVELVVEEVVEKDKEIVIGTEEQELSQPHIEESPDGGLIGKMMTGKNADVYEPIVVVPPVLVKIVNEGENLRETQTIELPGEEGVVENANAISAENEVPLEDAGDKMHVDVVDELAEAAVPVKVAGNEKNEPQAEQAEKDEPKEVSTDVLEITNVEKTEEPAKEAVVPDTVSRGDDRTAVTIEEAPVVDNAEPMDIDGDKSVEVPADVINDDDENNVDDFTFEQSETTMPVFGEDDPVAKDIRVKLPKISQLPEITAPTKAPEAPEPPISKDTPKSPKKQEHAAPFLKKLVSADNDSDSKRTNEACATCNSENSDNGEKSVWIECDGCRTWHHTACVEIPDDIVQKIDKFFCGSCEPIYGPYTLKRTSGRATTAIDYNALHHGSSAPIKNPTDGKLHPYIALIKDGKYPFLPDNLMRVVPEYLSTNFLEEMPNGWEDPFIVPAATNPAPWHLANDRAKAKSLEVQSPGKENARKQTPEKQGSRKPTPEKQSPEKTTSEKQSFEKPTPEKQSPEKQQVEEGHQKSQEQSVEEVVKSSEVEQFGVELKPSEDGGKRRFGSPSPPRRAKGKECVGTPVFAGGLNKADKFIKNGDLVTTEGREGADRLDMVIPEDLSVRKVAELIGQDRPVEMINVLSQSTTKDDKWAMEQLVEYSENPSRELIFNCISCEVSGTKLGDLIVQPEVVRELDLAGQVWREYADPNQKNPNTIPQVGKYILMSVKDSFTDFHIDFAGSSVFYHVYKGQKVFLVMPPTDKNLKIYEKWSTSPDMNAIFLPALIEDPCMIVTLNKGDTLFIPSGWIHAVYTPEDSLVVGGNFLTKNHYIKQLQVQRIEVATEVKLSQRYPKFTTLMWHVLYHYCTRDPIPSNIDSLLDNGYILKKKQRRALKSEPHYTVQELEGLPSVCNFLLRTALIAIDALTTSLVPGKPSLTASQINAVKKAIPKPCREDPLRYVQTFARWCVWKRACHGIVQGERLPDWAHSDWHPPQLGTKEPSATQLKKIQQQREEEARRAELPRRAGLRTRTAPSSTPGKTPEPRLFPEPDQRKIGRPPKRSADTNTPPPPKKRGRPPKVAPASSSENGVRSENQMTAGGTAARRGRKVDDEDCEPITLSDGCTYLRKLSNLGPPRTGCQNCRAKKTACLHKDEIKRILESYANGAGGIIKESKPAEAASEELPKSTEKATAKRKRDDEEEWVPEEGEVVIPEDDDDDDLYSLPKKKLTPTPQKKPKIPSTPGPKMTPAPKLVPTPAAVAGPSGPPNSYATPGLKPPRKPSCDECRAAKKKCLHDNTWHLIAEREVARLARKAESGGRRGTAHRAVARVTVLATQKNQETKIADVIGNGVKSDPIVPATTTTATTIPLIETTAHIETLQQDVTIANGDTVLEETETGEKIFDLDMSILDDEPSTAPSPIADPAIMAPPMDVDEDRKESSIPANSTINVTIPSSPPTPSPPTTATATAAATSTTMQTPFAQAAFNRSKRPKVTYSRASKSLKRRSEEEDPGRASSELKRTKVEEVSVSVGVAPAAGSLGEDVEMTAEDFRRASLGLRMGSARRFS
ncbi:JmjC domain-containing histone demethylation protein 1 [Rhizina undulata]